MSRFYGSLCRKKIQKDNYKCKLECGPMPNVMAALKIQLAPSVENDEERKFRNSIPCTMPQCLAGAHCPSAVQ